MSVQLSVLGSGSKGNCTAVWTANTVLLIDAGKLALRYIKTSLAHAGLEPPSVDAILITHSHTDHLSDTTCRLCLPESIPVYCSGATWKSALRRKSNRRLEELEKHKLHRPLPDGEFRIGDFVVKPFAVSHAHPSSAGSPVGYTLRAEGVKVFYATDLGFVSPEIEEEIADSDVLVIESNHDVQMERNSSRPRDTIEWVLSDTGHLSNEQCAAALGSAIARNDRAPRHVVLSHLSEECNLPQLALSASKKAFTGSSLRRVNLIAASQKVPTPVISVEA